MAGNRTSGAAMRKRSSYKPRPSGPGVLLAILSRNRPVDSDEALRGSLSVHLAADAIRQGKATGDDWRRLMMATNIVEMLCQLGVVKDEDGAIEALQSKLLTILTRINATHKTALWGDELRDINEFVAIYADILPSLTRQELYSARAAVEHYFQTFQSRGLN